MATSCHRNLCTSTSRQLLVKAGGAHQHSAGPEHSVSSNSNPSIHLFISGN